MRVATTRKKRITYEQVEGGLNWINGKGFADWHGEWITPTQYILACKEATGLADWKIAKDLSVDSGVEVAAVTVRLWRKKGEKRA